MTINENLSPLSPKLRVALFVTCLVDLMRPEIGFASIKLLEQAGCEVIVPAAQSCCGQPAYNSGDMKSARKVARQILKNFAEFDYIIVPSGSCAGMLHHHLPQLFTKGSLEHDQASALAAKTRELSQFLIHEMKYKPEALSIKGKAVYHDSCSSFREMKIDGEPRTLLASQADLSVQNLNRREGCCGFGGLFCVKYPEISNQMVMDKVDDIVSFAPDYLLAGDLGCLMNIAGKLQKNHHQVQCYHYAEVLAFGVDHAGITAAPKTKHNK